MGSFSSTCCWFRMRVVRPVADGASPFARFRGVSSEELPVRLRGEVSDMGSVEESEGE